MRDGIGRVGATQSSRRFGAEDRLDELVAVLGRREDAELVERIPREHDADIDGGMVSRWCRSRGGCSGVDRWRPGGVITDPAALTALAQSPHGRENLPTAEKLQL